MGDDRAIVYIEPETQKVIYRGSAIGSCVKSLVAARLGIEGQAPPSWLQKAFNEGNNLESVVVDKLKDKGIEVYDAQQELEYDLLGGRVAIRGHIDGKAKHGNNENLVEIKCFSRKYWEKWEQYKWKAFRNYAYQVSFYMFALEIYKVLFCVGIKTPDGKGIEEVVVYEYHRPPVDFASIKAVVNEVEKWADKGELPVECDLLWSGCPYAFLHEEKPETDLHDQAFDKLVFRLEEIKKEEKQLGEEKAAIGTELQHWFEKLEIRGGKINTDQYIVNDVIKVSKRLDYGAVAEAGIDLEQYKKIGKETRYITVRDKTKSKDKD